MPPDMFRPGIGQEGWIDDAAAKVSQVPLAAQSRPWRVLVLEDDLQTRNFFVRSLDANAQLSVVGAVGSVSQAQQWLAGAGQDGPDVLLADLRLPDGSGLEVIAEVLSRFPDCECLVITVFADADSVLESVKAGAVGYILKDAAPADIAATILDMKAGAAPMSPMIARRVLAACRQMPANPAAELVSLPPADIPLATASQTETASALDLTPREFAVLGLIARGFSYREIAGLLELSVHTVQSHIKNLYRKLAVNSKSEAVFEASRLGLLTLGK